MSFHEFSISHHAGQIHCRVSAGQTPEPAQIPVPGVLRGFCCSVPVPPVLQGCSRLYQHNLTSHHSSQSMPFSAGNVPWDGEGCAGHDITWLGSAAVKFTALVPVVKNNSTF